MCFLAIERTTTARSASVVLLSTRGDDLLAEDVSLADDLIGDEHLPRLIAKESVVDVIEGNRRVLSPSETEHLLGAISKKDQQLIAEVLAGGEGDLARELLRVAQVRGELLVNEALRDAHGGIPFALVRLRAEDLHTLPIGGESTCAHQVIGDALEEDFRHELRLLALVVHDRHVGGEAEDPINPWDYFEEHFVIEEGCIVWGVASAKLTPMDVLVMRRALTALRSSEKKPDAAPCNPH